MYIFHIQAMYHSMNISAIVAATENNMIGKGGLLPWYLPTDLIYFKNRTWGLPVIMGRKTYQSIGLKPLIGRQNIIISRNPEWNASGVIIASDMIFALNYAKSLEAREVFILGGAEIFSHYMSFLDKIYMTRIHVWLDGDTYFPEIDEMEWEKTREIHHAKDERNLYALDFQIWEKIVVPEIA